MQKGECLHLNECKQLVQENDYLLRCLGKMSWNQENCYRTNAMDTVEKKFPLEWWGIQENKKFEEWKKKKRK